MDFSEQICETVLIFLSGCDRINLTSQKNEEDTMFENMENLKLLSASTGVSKKQSHVEFRKNHSFVYRPMGAGTFYFQNKHFTVRENEMIFLPCGSSYDFISVPESDCCFCAIMFEADIHHPEPTVYSMENFPEARDIFSHFADLWKLEHPSDKYKCYAMFYSLISHISNLENTDYAAKQKFQLIAPAVQYLRDHIFDSHLKTDHLHLLCGISDTYFRKIFVAKFAQTPQKYIISKRISHAKALIDNGDFETITEVAASVGYTDPLYFSRAFRKKYGISPMKMNKESS